MGAIERKGTVVARVVAHVDTDTADAFVNAAVAEKVDLVATDESGVYHRINRKRPHQFVTHGRGEYVRGNVHTCTNGDLTNSKTPLEVRHALCTEGNCIDGECTSEDNAKYTINDANCTLTMKPATPRTSRHITRAVRFRDRRPVGEVSPTIAGTSQVPDSRPRKGRGKVDRPPAISPRPTWWYRSALPCRASALRGSATPRDMTSDLPFRPLRLTQLGQQQLELG